MFQLLIAATVANLTLLAGHRAPTGAIQKVLQLARTAAQRFSQPFCAFAEAARRLVAAAMLAGARGSALPNPFTEMATFRPGL